MNKTTHNYLSLAIICMLYLASITYFKTAPILVVMATSVFAVLYIVWGVLHAHTNHNLHAKVVLEYFLVALLGVTIVSTLLI